MRHLQKIIEVDGYKWRVTITDTKQLILSFNVPPELSETKGDRRLAAPLDSDPYYQDEWSEGHKNMPKDFSIFKLVNAVFKTISELVNVHKLEFFYFEANFAKKGRIYHKFSKRLIEELKGDWKYQVFEEKWFYLTRNENLSMFHVPHE